MRSITFWMASSEAWSCIATIIAIHFPWPRVGAAKFVLRVLLVAALQGAHDVHDAFKDVLNLLVRQRPLVDAADVFEDGLFALGFVDGQVMLAASGPRSRSLPEPAR